MTALAHHREQGVDVVLRDGSTVRLRPVRPDDEPALLTFLEHLDERSLWFRFFTGAVDLQRSADDLADVDGRRRFGLLARRVTGGAIVGHGLFAGLDANRAEVALAIAPEVQGHGLGPILLDLLAAAAHQAGFSILVAEVLATNHPMIEMLRENGRPIEVRSIAGTLIVEMPTLPASRPADGGPSTTPVVADSGCAGTAIAI